MTDIINEHPLAQMYNRLSPEMVLDAVEAGGHRCTGRFIILNSYENRVYQFELDDDSWVVGKFYRPGRWPRETILAEHQFLQELDEAEIPVISPLFIHDEETIGVTEDGIMYSVFPRVGGRSPEELTDPQIQQLGHLIARIHNVGAMHHTPHRMELSPLTYGLNNLEFLLEKDCIPSEARDIFEHSVRALIDRIQPLFHGVPMHRIHGDCHMANLIDTGKNLTFLDFDDMVIGPAAQDIWMLIPSYDDHGKQQREQLIEAYTEFRDFDHSWLRLVEPLRALRFVHYATWIARRWEDPIFKKTFTHFGDVQYWQREIQDLREQIARIDQLDHQYMMYH